MRRSLSVSRRIIPTQLVGVLADRHQLAEAADRLAVDPHRHRHKRGIAKAGRNRRQLDWTEFAGNELPDVLIFVRVGAEVAKVTLGRLVDGQNRRRLLDPGD